LCGISGMNQPVWSDNVHNVRPSIERHTAAIAIDRHATAAPTLSPPPQDQRLLPETTQDLRASLAGLRPKNRHPVVLLDPRPESHRAVTQWRSTQIPLCVLTSRRLEPASFARGIRRCRLPAMHTRPERWEACLLELAAQLEPRAILVPGSRAAVDLLCQLHARLSPHFAITHLHSLMPDGLENAPTAEAALRRAVLRGEPAMEVQVVLDQAGLCTAQCVLTWTAGARPDTIVTSVEGAELIEASLALLRQRQLVGYARLIWAPDRHGRLTIHAASVLPGLGWSLALDDGVDFPLQWYAALVGQERLPQNPTRSMSRRLAILEPGTNDDSLPLSPYTPGWSWRDPLPWFAGFLCSLVRR